MERLLVSMDARHGAWEAWSRAVSLARRIDASVYALFVATPQQDAGAGPGASELSTVVRKRLDLLVEAAKADGVDVALYVTEGQYEAEVVRFAQEHRITLLVAEHQGAGTRGVSRDMPDIQKIRHLIQCRVELVSPRRNHNCEEKKDHKP
jgi:nucleotide-binding universal stress UspA family protein